MSEEETQGVSSFGSQVTSSLGFQKQDRNRWRIFFKNDFDWLSKWLFLKASI